MTIEHLARSTALAGVSALAMIATSAAAQTVPPIRQNVDANGVDLVTGQFNHSSTDVVIGNGDNAMAYTREWNGGGKWRDNLVATINNNGAVYTVSIGDSSDQFTLSGGAFTNDEGNGATLELVSGDYVYTTASGVVAVFAPANGQFDLFNSNVGWIRHITTPNGDRWTYTYKTGSWCPDANWNGSSCGVSPSTSVRIQSVINRFGNQLKLEYAANSLTNQSSLTNWGRVTKVTGINNAADYCDPAADSCSLGSTWPFSAYARSGATETVTDGVGLRRTYSYDGSNQIVGIRRAGAASDSTSIAYAGGFVSSVTNEGVTSTYTVTGSNPFDRTMTVTSPIGHVRTLNINVPSLLVLQDFDPLGRRTSFTYDSKFRVATVTAPDGNYAAFTYDARGNVGETRLIAKPGSGLADIVTSAGFDASCANPKICNKPLWTRDAKGNQTDYTYDSGHGGLLTVTAPAATGGGIRPQTRYSYSGLQAYFKNSGGSIVASGVPIQLLTGVSACQTSASCTGAADEAKTSISYGPQTNGVANNLLPVSATSGSGNGALAVTVATTYDSIGNALTVDGPLAGADDTSRARYDARRRLIGTVSPDPDGAGSLPHRASRITYNADGQVTQQEAGTVTSQSDAAWAALTSLQQVVVSYDANARPVKAEAKAGGTTYAVTQSNYDSLGRVNCVATRMDPAVWAGQADACVAQTGGPNGPDRIFKTLYNQASEVTSVKAAVGTASENTKVSYYYTQNGKLTWLTDGENNRTTYEYDGHDRLLKTRFPSPTQGANASSTTDYEQLTYDANGNVTQRRLRDGQVHNLGYDNLDRLTSRDVPNIVYSEYDTSYAYDLLGRLDAIYGSTGLLVGYGYDALGRVVTAQSNFGIKSLQYDAAGRRTRLTWGDGFFVTYDYLMTGEMSAIRENGATSGVGVLGTYAYDSLGRRTTLTRGNGAVTTWSYDPVSRLSSLAHNVAGTTNDVSTSFTYNPAGQIKTSTRDNDLFAYTTSYGASRSYANNGLNQTIAISGGTSLIHDARGNITNVGAKTYEHTSDNRLALFGASGYVVYDPAGRLLQVADGGVYTRYDYLGNDIVSELDTSNLITRRYVHGPGTDEPLVWYEGSGTSGRRWLHADERGSVVAISDGSGVVTNINRYDEYGVPATTNAGRFGYTGQYWLGQSYSADGLWHYKARAYAPALGRFLQTDPIGYGAGPNLYAYVGGDPVNFTDPLGLKQDKAGPPNPYVNRRDPIPASDEDEDESDPITVTAQGCIGSFCNYTTDPGSIAEFILRLTVSVRLNLGGSGRSGGNPGTGDGIKDVICPKPSQSTAGKIADYADNVGLGADATAAVAVGFGLATAPSGAGPLGAGIVAIGAKAVGVAANVVGFGANVADGNVAGAAGNVVSIVAGNVAGGLASRALIRGRMFGNLTAQGQRAAAGVNSATSAGVQGGSKVGCRKK